MTSPPVVELAGVRKNYYGLRPLRIERLIVHAGETVAVGGLDAAAGEALTNLLTGATLPDEGDVRLFGRSTASLSTAEQWLEWLDRLGLVSHRAVLLDGLTVEQNLAMSFTLEVDPVSAAIRPRVSTLAGEVGLDAQTLSLVTGEVGPEVALRVRLARAIALDPRVLLLEHPTASLPRASVRAFVHTLRAMSRSRALAVLAISGDAVVQQAADRAFELEPATGQLRPLTGWTRWLRLGER